MSVSSILGYRSMLSSVFRFKLPEISSSPVLRDLLCSFKVETSVRSVGPPSWDLDLVLRYFNSATFEPLALASLRNLTKKIFFRLREFVSFRRSLVVSLFVASDACM